VVGHDLPGELFIGCCLLPSLLVLLAVLHAFYAGVELVFEDLDGFDWVLDDKVRELGVELPDVVEGEVEPALPPDYVLDLLAGGGVVQELLGLLGHHLLLLFVETASGCHHTALNVRN